MGLSSYLFESRVQGSGSEGFICDGVAEQAKVNTRDRRNGASRKTMWRSTRSSLIRTVANSIFAGKNLSGTAAREELEFPFDEQS